MNKDTLLCISVASRPSSFGMTLHNAAYQALGLNYAYKAFGISDIAGAVAGVRALGIRGCSVSMPFKQAVIPYLDEIDDAARVIGAVNTVVNDGGRLTGFNTDISGAAIVLEEIKVRPEERILLLGAGGAARAVLFALARRGCHQILVTNRDERKANSLGSIVDCTIVSWDRRNVQGADVVINATPIGMAGGPSISPIDEPISHNCRAVFDLVVTPHDTELIRKARADGKAIAMGHQMSLHQAAAQFTHYTKMPAPMDALEAALQRWLHQ